MTNTIEITPAIEATMNVWYFAIDAKDKAHAALNVANMDVKYPRPHDTRLPSERWIEADRALEAFHAAEYTADAAWRAFSEACGGNENAGAVLATVLF